MTSTVAKTVATDKLSEMKDYFSSKNKLEINWNDFNYPPLLHVIHFDLSELSSIPEIQK